MELTRIVMVFGLGRALWAVPDHRVTVCLDLLHSSLIAPSADLASRIFADAGIAIDWRDGASCPDSADVIRINLRNHTADGHFPGALAYALPYEGTHIEIFYDRVRQSEMRTGCLELFGYVLVHEITHILQEDNSHSEGEL